MDILMQWMFGIVEHESDKRGVKCTLWKVTDYKQQKEPYQTLFLSYDMTFFVTNESSRVSDYQV